MLSIHSYREQGTFVVELAGKMMGGTEQQEFHSQVKEAVDDGCNGAVIDLKNVEWLNSWGVGQLVSAYTTMKNKGGLLVLSGCSPKIMTILKLTRFDSIFSFEPDLSAALTYCRTQISR
ncbi:MAG: STAS domain-containing protein [Calditrichaeota bacterium]|nr:STAS domain-containing protein [Calditrichota bacterium]MCB9366058.1 STAS domain-containing protein [Calditrichota bacterium]MCB9391816.1 STAS domain-containing protein [Calditrichota bacterium]